MKQKIWAKICGPKTFNKEINQENNQEINSHFEMVVYTVRFIAISYSL